MAKYLDKTGLETLVAQIKYAYLSKLDAQSIYLTKEDYDQRVEELNVTLTKLYLKITDAEATYLNKTDAAAIYAKKEDIVSVYYPKGTVTAASIPDLSNVEAGWVYNVSTELTTNDKYLEGTGKTYPAGTNIVCIEVSGTKMWDVLAGFVDLSGYVLLDDLTTTLASYVTTTKLAEELGKYVTTEWINTNVMQDLQSYGTEIDDHEKRIKTLEDAEDHEAIPTSEITALFS